MQRTDMARSDAGNAMDSLGEVVPRDNALIREVVDSRYNSFIRIMVFTKLLPNVE